MNFLNFKEAEKILKNYGFVCGFLMAVEFWYIEHSFKMDGFEPAYTMLFAFFEVGILSTLIMKFIFDSEDKND